MPCSLEIVLKYGYFINFSSHSSYRYPEEFHVLPDNEGPSSRPPTVELEVRVDHRSRIRMPRECHHLTCPQGSV